MKKYLFGIDVGGTSVKCGLFSPEGEILEKWEIPTRTEDRGSHILPDVAVSVLGKIAERQIPKEEVLGIGIGIPGDVTDEGVAERAVNIYWGYTEIVRQMEEMTGIRTKAANDANVAALGEYWKGGGAGCRNMILVTLGTGVGGGIIINGKVIAGEHGAAGEIGHAHVDDTITDPCNCGNCGCLEQVASATGIVRLANEALASSSQDSVLRDGGSMSARKVFDAVKAGDPLAIGVAERFGAYLGKALQAFACVCDPEAIVIGGGVSKAGPILLTFIEKYYRQYAYEPFRRARFELAQLGNDAGIYGCAKMMLE